MLPDNHYAVSASFMGRPPSVTFTYLLSPWRLPDRYDAHSGSQDRAEKWTQLNPLACDNVLTNTSSSILLQAPLCERPCSVHPVQELGFPGRRLRGLEITHLDCIFLGWPCRLDARRRCRSDAKICARSLPPSLHHSDGCGAAPCTCPESAFCPPLSPCEKALTRLVFV